MAILEEDQKRLLEKSLLLPPSPGVYLMRDGRGEIIYVGKARRLNGRVPQYFRGGEKDPKTARMTAAAQDFDYILCANETEALTLENTLIKRHAPKYNIRLKDAKSYPYIKITDEPYPRFIMTRRREPDNGRYFGPYSGVSTVYAVLDTLQRALGLPACRRRFPRDIGRERPCLYYQMGRCCAPCAGHVTEEAYGALVSLGADILRGRIAEAKRELTARMNAHAEAERFEAAARCRDAIAALERLRERQTVVAAPDAEQDVFGFCADDTASCVSVLRVRGGAVVDNENRTAGGGRILDQETFGAFVCGYYRSGADIPKEILLSLPLDAEELSGLSDCLSREAGRRVSVRVPARGPARSLCAMADGNAAEGLRRYRQDSGKDEAALARLAEILGLETLPARIEAYDISNLGAEQATAAMIVCEDGRFVRRDYRVFRIRSAAGNDDYGAMREAIRRRLSRLRDGGGTFPERPDLILLDGGRGHVSAVRAVMREEGEDIPVFGMVKDERHRTRALCAEGEDIEVPRDENVFLLLYRIQEEVHRFAVSRMSQAKRRTLTRSVLTRVPGIGDVKAKALLRAFGGLSGIREASEDSLAAVKGISRSDAARVRDYFDAQTARRPDGASWEGEMR